MNNQNKRLLRILYALLTGGVIGYVLAHIIIKVY